MDVSRYEIFTKVAECGSLTEAARLLGCTQSNISHSLRSMEREYGFPLFKRGRHGAKLTPEGERLAPYFREVAAKERELSRAARSLRGKPAEMLRIAAFTSVAVHWLPGILKGFQDMEPGVRFELLNGDYHDVDEWIETGSADLAFVRLPSQLPCRFIPLYEDPLLAILPVDHPLAGSASFPIREAADEPFISLLENSSQDSILTLREEGIEPDVRFTTKDDYALIAMVEKGLGISIIPSLLLEGRSDRVRAIPLSPPASRTIALAIPESSTSTSGSALSRFSDFVCGWVQRYPSPEM